MRISSTQRALLEYLKKKDWAQAAAVFKENTQSTQADLDLFFKKGLVDFNQPFDNPLFVRITDKGRRALLSTSERSLEYAAAHWIELCVLIISITTLILALRGSFESSPQNGGVNTTPTVATSEQLATYNWSLYKDDSFGFQFKYPDYVSVCPSPYRDTSASKLRLEIRMNETCAEADSNKDAASILMTIAGNANNYSSAQEAFYKEFPGTASSSGEIGYFKLGGLDAYGGSVKVPNGGTWVGQSDYDAVVLKNNLLFEVSDHYYDVTVGGNPAGDKPVLDAMLSTFYFEPMYSPWE
jgi:hypothetical protein